MEEPFDAVADAKAEAKSEAGAKSEKGTKVENSREASSVSVRNSDATASTTAAAAATAHEGSSEPTVPDMEASSQSTNEEELSMEPVSRRKIAHPKVDPKAPIAAGGTSGSATATAGAAAASAATAATCATNASGSSSSAKASSSSSSSGASVAKNAHNHHPPNNPQQPKLLLSIIGETFTNITLLSPCGVDNSRGDFDEPAVDLKAFRRSGTPRGGSQKDKIGGNGNGIGIGGCSQSSSSCQCPDDHRRLSSTEGGGGDRSEVNTSDGPTRSSLLNQVTEPFTVCVGLKNNASGEERGKNSSNSKSSNDEQSASDVSYTNSCEEEVLQMKRLASWNTIDTDGTLRTNSSAVGSPMEDARSAVVNNGGSVASGGGGGGTTASSTPSPTTMVRKTKSGKIETINPIVDEAKRRRHRLVKFEYPHVSSLKQCPRPDPNDLPQLFFTEEELDQIEDDRVSTYTADDVEVVAVSTSMSSDPEQPTSTTHSHHSATSGTPVSLRNGGSSSVASASNAGAGAGGAGFGAYVPTPRKWTKQKKTSFHAVPENMTRSRSAQRDTSSVSTASQHSNNRKLSRRRSATPGPSKQRHDNHNNSSSNNSVPSTMSTTMSTTSSKASRKGERLIKSVQIYLRERSTGR